jgi:hypothetical protein
MANRDNIKIKFSRFQRQLISTLTILSFRDNDTKQHVKYAPSLELSGYGKTLAKAEEMLQEAIHDEFRRLIAMQPKQVRASLINLGWMLDPLHNKQLSHVVIDKHGALQGFNVDLNSVKEEQLEHHEQITVA